MNEERIEKLTPLSNVSESVAQREANTENNLDVEDKIEQTIRLSIHNNSPLPKHVKSFMEPRFGIDFSGVRAHTGPLASQLNEELNAQAFRVRPETS